MSKTLDAAIAAGFEVRRQAEEEARLRYERTLQKGPRCCDHSGFDHQWISHVRMGTCLICLCQGPTI